ncbi:MAG: 30S ribosomal protein S16 [Patescibacteria group bacterium]
MLAIKLKRIGKRGQASFRIVVQEKRSKLGGRYVEDLGWLNPHNNKSSIKKDRIEYWIKTGAQPTDSVYNMLVKNSIIKGPKKPVHKISKKKIEGQANKQPETPVAA